MTKKGFETQLDTAGAASVSSGHHPHRGRTFLRKNMTFPSKVPFVFMLSLRLEPTSASRIAVELPVNIGLNEFSK